MTKLYLSKRLFALLVLSVVGWLTYGFSVANWDLEQAQRIAEREHRAVLDAKATTVASECSQENQAFSEGERVIYKLYYNLNFIWVPAGEVEFKVEDHGAQFKVTATGTTYSSYEWFFKVRDRYESYIDKRTLLPAVAIRDIKEGNYSLYERLEFDQANRTGKTYRGHTKEEAMRKATPFRANTCLHDVLSSIYYMRNFTLDGTRPNSKIPISVIMSHEVYPLNVRYIGKEGDKKIRGLGRLEAHELAPEIVAGDVFNENSEMRVWASTSASHVPVLIESPVSVGSVKAVLKSHHRLRHPLPVQ